MKTKQLKPLINGKIYTYNNNGRIEVYTEREYIELMQMKWWEKVIKNYF